MNVLSLSKYFDAWKLVRSSKIKLTDQQVKNINKISKGIDVDHSVLIAKLILQRKAIKYPSNKALSDELKQLYNAYNSMPAEHNPLDYLTKPPIKKITIELTDGTKIVLKHKTLLWNLCYQGFKFLKLFYHSYIQKSFKPDAIGKGKSATLDASNRVLAKQIIKYLKENTTLQQKEIGDYLIGMFESVGNPLEYSTGKIAYDSITRKR